MKPGVTSDPRRLSHACQPAAVRSWRRSGCRECRHRAHRIKRCSPDRGRVHLGSPRHNGLERRPCRKPRRQTAPNWIRTTREEGLHRDISAPRYFSHCQQDIGSSEYSGRPQHFHLPWNCFFRTQEFPGFDGISFCAHRREKQSSILSLTCRRLNGCCRAIRNELT